MSNNFINTGGMDLSGLGANGVTPMTSGGGVGGNQQEIFSEYFGPPNRPIHVNPYELFSRQNFALPEAYVGRNDYLVNIIITTIKEEEMWAGRIALPFRIADSQYEIQWDEIHFDNQLLGPVPEEGVSRLVTQRTSSRKDHYVRYGLAFQLEHGFMNTEKGKMSYVNNLKQIRNATLDTIYLGVIRAYLSCKTVGQALVEMYGTNPSQAQIRRILSEELENWACVQKSSNALQICDLRMKRRMRKMGATPDMWIFPEGMKTYITNVRRENFDYFIKGPDGPKMFQSGISDNGQKLDIAMDCVIFEAKQFDIPEAPEPIDLLCRNQSIGEYVTLQNHLMGFNDWGKYSSRMRDIVVYNEERDSWSTITLEQCLHFCMRFGEPTEIGRKRRRDDDESGDDHKKPIDHGDDDMFLSGDGTRANYMGDLTERTLNSRAVFDISQCLYERILREESSDFNIATAISEGVMLCDKISTPPGTYNLEIDTDGFPKADAMEAKPGIALTGFGTYAGMKKLAGMTSETFKKEIEIAQKLVKAVDIIYGRLQGMGNSVFLNADYQQPWLKVPDGRNTLFANLIFEPLMQMEVSGEDSTFTAKVENAIQGLPKLAKEATVENAKDMYKEILQTSDTISDEEASLLEQESILFLQCLGRVKFDEPTGSKPLNVILRIIKAAVEMVGEGDTKADLIDLHRALRHVFSSKDDEFEKRLNLFMDIIAKKDPVTKENRDSYFTSKLKTGSDKVYVTFESTATFSQLGVKYGDKPQQRMFGFSMEGYEEPYTVEARQVGAQNEFRYYDNKKVDFAGFQSFGAGNTMGMEESVRSEMMREGKASVIKEKFSETFLEKFNYYSASSASATDLHRIICQAFMGLPITEGNLKKLIYTDIPFPFGFICFRPYMTYRMGSGILAVKGSTTGETLIGHANFQLGDDPVQKMHIGNFTMYEKSVVYKPHQVSIAQNIYSMGYIGGNDCRFYSSREELSENTPGNIKASIFSCIVPYEGTGSSDGMQSANEFPNPMSITGKFEHSTLAALQDPNSAPHYPSAKFYSEFWRWTSPTDPDHSDKMYEVPNTLNTVCYQGHQQAYNPATYQYDIVTTNTGHWGEKIYPGCGKVRRGVEKMLQSVTYAGSATPYPSVTQIDY